MDSNLTICLLLATLICLSPAILYVVGVIKDPFHPLMFVGALTFFVTTYSPLRHQRLVLEYLPGDIWARYQILVCAIICAIYGGWIYSSRRRKRWLAQGIEETIRPVDYAEYNDWTLLLIGAVLITVGVCMFLLKYEDLEGSGYARDLGTLWLPGSVLMIQVMVRNPRLRMAALCGLILALVPPINRFLVYGQRGDTARLALLLLCFYMTRGKRPSKGLFIGAAVGLAILLSSLTATRNLVANGEATNRITALLQVGPKFFTTAPEELSGGEEYVYGTVATEHAREVGSWGYAAAVTYVPLIHTLPHEFFPWKFDYFYMHTNYDWPEIRSMFGIQIANGSAPTGIADLFIDQWWFSLITWFLLGYAIHRSHLRTSIHGNIRSQGIFIGIMVGLLYLISQEIYFAYMNVLYNLPPLLIAYRMARVKTSEMALQPAF
jgi:hypothetical protein